MTETLPTILPQEAWSGSSACAQADRYPGIDLTQGLQVWEELPLYVKYLGKYAERHAASPQNLKMGIATEDLKAVRVLVHALAGGSANLGLTRTALLAGDAERQLVAGQDASAVLALLQAELGTALASIHRLLADRSAPAVAPPPNPGLDQVSASERPDLQNLLDQLLLALDSDSHEPVEPVLKTLGTYLSAHQLLGIIDRLDDFDFRGAEACARELAHDLGLQLRGTSP